MELLGFFQDFFLGYLHEFLLGLFCKFLLGLVLKFLLGIPPQNASRVPPEVSSGIPLRIPSKIPPGDFSVTSPKKKSIGIHPLIPPGIPSGIDFDLNLNCGPLGVQNASVTHYWNKWRNIFK